MSKIVYISLPMAGEEETIWERWEQAQQYIKETPGYEDANIVSPVNIIDFAPGKEINKEREHTYGRYIGRDIERLCECTDILMCYGWQLSRGCRIEHETAKVMNIHRIYMQKR